jgi:hypothetical protein
MRSLLRDPSGDCVGVLHKVVIRNSNDRDSHSRKFAIARLVALTAEIVGASVQFNREPGRIAIKIKNEVACDLLPAEVQSVALAATESVPEHTLRAGHRATEQLGELNFFWSDRLAVHDCGARLARSHAT